MARWGLAVSLLASCTLSSPPLEPVDGAPGDAAEITDAAPEPPALPSFTAPVVIAELSATGAADDDVTLTADRRLVLLNSTRDGDEDIFFSSRADIDSPWPTPEPVVELNSLASESTTAISADGLAVLFASERDGDSNLFLATRPDRDSPWSPPSPIDELNSGAGEFAGYVSVDRLTVIFHSDREGDFDLYIARRRSEVDPFDPPEPIAGVNSAGEDASARLVAGDRVLTFHSDRDGDPDLYAATRATPGDAFGPVAPIAELNSPEIEQDLWLGDDLCSVVFAATDAAGESSIVESRCVE